MSGFSCNNLAQACQNITGVITELTEDTRHDHSVIQLSLSSEQMQLMIAVSDEEMG
jgi:hypothetical protein